MAQVQELQFSAVEVGLARRFRARGVSLVATPGPLDRFLTFEQETLTWEVIERRFPSLPLGWWRTALDSPIAQSHVWLADKGWLLSGECRTGRLFVVPSLAATLPKEPVAEFLVDERHMELRNVLVHLDLFA